MPEIHKNQRACPPEVMNDPVLTEGLEQTIAEHMTSGLQLTCLAEAAGELEYAHHCDVTNSCALAAIYKLAHPEGSE